MPRFVYQARSGGQLIEGALEAPSAERVASLLGERGAIPVSIRADTVADAARPAVAAWGRKRVSLDELIMLSRQLRSLTKSGVPIVRALRGLAQSAANARLATVLNEVVDSLEAGADLATSLRRHPDVFTDLYVSVVHVGENTGRMDEAFAQVGEYLLLERDTKRRVQSASRYPLFVLGTIAVAIGIVNIYVIPSFRRVFEGFHAQLPWQTRFLITMSDAFVAYWWVAGAVLIAVALGLRHWLATEAGRLRWDEFKLGLPVIGGLYRRINLARFCQTFAMVLHAGVPLIQGLAIVGHAIGNAWMAERIRDMRWGIERGESIGRTAVASGLFSPVVLQMIAVGEDTGRIDELLAEAALFYGEEVDYGLKTLADSIEPILIIAIGGLVLILALGVFLPLWDLSSVAFRK